MNDLVYEQDPLAASVTSVSQRLQAVEDRLASTADPGLPWWEQKVGPVPSWVIVGAIGLMAFLGWKRSR